MAEFQKLFEPGRIGKVVARNRIVMAPMGTGFDHGGFVTDAMADFYARRARGGVGIVVTEAAAVHVSGHIPSLLDFYDDRFLEGMARMAAAIQANGALAFCQLNHPGRQTASRLTGHDIVAPSAIASRPAYETPEPASVETIRMIIDAYAAAAERAKRAGFDGVEFHGAHGYLICAFMSPAANKRDDEFGGDTVRRARFATEIVRESRKRCGPDFPITMRISGDDYLPDGLRVEETARIAQLLEQAGVDAISVSAGCYDTFERIVPPMWFPQACNATEAAAIRKALKVPVIVAGRINDPDIAESLLAGGTADFVAIGRGLLCDADFANKARDGRAGDIVRCVACNTCIDTMYSSQPIRCILNPELGREGLLDGKAERSKRVMVIGGGPGGMYAAARLARRGHSVVLYEREPELGGRIPLCATPEWKKGFELFTAQLRQQATASGVEVHTGEEATAGTVAREAPEAVILATGAEAVAPPVPGLENVKAVQAEDVLTGKAELGHRIFIVGAGSTGCEVALVLARRGHEVTVAEMRPRIGIELGVTARWTKLVELKRSARLLPGVTCEQALSNAMVVSKDGKSETIPFDTLVLATGLRPRNALLAALEMAVPEVYAIGDCVKARSIADAMYEAADAVARI